MRHQLQNPKRAVSRQFAVSTAFLALPLLFLVPAKAQTQDAVSPKNAAVEARTKAKVDPKARLVLERMFAAYKNAKTLRDVVEFRVTGEPLGGLENSRITIASDRSGERKKLMVTKVAGGTTSMAVTDGVTLYATRSSDPAHYLKLDSESSVWQTWGQDSTYVFPAINATMPGVAILFENQGVDGLVKDGMTSLSLGQPQIVGGAIAETLTVTLAPPDKSRGKTEMTMTFVCFRSDGLLCRLIYDLTRYDNGVSRKTRFTEEHTKTVVNRPIADSVFTFTAPVSATAVTKFD